MAEITFPSEIPKFDKQTHNLFEVTPFNEPKLGFSIVLPKSWKATPDLGKQKFETGEPLTISVFVESSEKEAAILSITYTPMPFEIPLAGWIDFLNEAYSAKVVMQREIETGKWPAVDIGCIYPKDRIVRTLYFKDGPGIYAVSGSAPSSKYDKVKDNILLALSTFQIKMPYPTEDPNMVPYSEEILSITIHDPDFEFAYPASWGAVPVNSDIKGKSGADIRLDQDGKLAGYVRVKANDLKTMGKTSEKQLIEVATSEFSGALDSTKKAPVILKSDWKQVESPIPNAHMYFAQGELNKMPVELRLGIVQKENLIFVLSCLSVKKSDAWLVWMRTYHAFCIALETVTPK